MKKRAVILFNLGAPDSLEGVEKFLFNLFNDKAIISLPNPFRYFFARLISKKRAKIASEIYKLIGGKSPLLEETQKQALELEKLSGDKVFIAMRYYHPFAYEVIEEIRKYDPEEIILLPLYPQFSTTTTASSIKDWKNQAKKIGLDKPTKIICCYSDDERFIASHVNLIREAITEDKNFRILFSAHGIPEYLVKMGDPYQWQVERTVARIMDNLADDIDYEICYQSKVGPLKWLEPKTEDEIERAGKEGINIIIVPIAFVSEHSETLVELDIEYKHIADKFNVEYYRVKALGTDEKFIESLNYLINNEQKPVCPNNFSKCHCKNRI